ncbi:MAG: SDR family oxidoreductase [Gemmatimonadales bacterium]
MEIGLTGKNALVCGSSQGIGRAAAEALARNGARVTLLARDRDTLASVAQSLDGAAHDFLTADFDDPEQVRRVVAEYLNSSAPFHILVNNTGGPKAGEIVEAQGDEFLLAFKRHLVCNQLLAQALLPGMKAAGYGRIVNIASTSVREPIRGLGVSNTIRGAVASWAKTLAREVAPDGVTVNNVLPGYTDTARLRSLINTRAEATGQTVEQVTQSWVDVIPTGRFASPAEIAVAIAFLASPAASYITGVSLPVDGGRIAAI